MKETLDYFLKRDNKIIEEEVSKENESESKCAKTVKYKPTTNYGVEHISANNIVSKRALRRVQKSTMQTIADTLRMTYGPLGSNSWLITGSDKQSLKNEFSKDGRTVLKKILFSDPIEMAIQSEIEEIALYTDKEVGDGTTSATLISNAIFQRFYEYEDKYDLSPYNIIRGFKEVISEIQKRILEKKRETTIEDIYNICMISTNGNEEISEEITNIYREYGLGVFIDVKTSNDSNNKIKIYDVLTIDEGYSDPAYINNKKDGTCSIRNARVYYFADPIDTPDMVSLFEKIIYNNIIDPLNNQEDDVIPTVIVSPKITADASSMMRKVVEFMYGFDHTNQSDQKPPLLIISNIGYRSPQMDDIAQLCGCKVIHRYIDPKLQNKDIEKGLAPTIDTVCDFYGECDLVEADIVSTKFINPSCMHEKDEDGTITVDEDGKLVFSTIFNSLYNFLEAELNNAIINNEDSATIGSIRKRMQSLKSNMVEYQVGGITISDRDSLKVLIEDAVKNCRSAVTNGVGVAANFGAFNAALKVYTEYSSMDISEAEMMASRIIVDAYLDIIKLLYNSVFDNEETVNNIIYESVMSGNPYNIRTGEYDGKVLTSIDTDIKILDTIARIVSLMLTSNQVIIQHPNLNKY